MGGKSVNYALIKNLYEQGELTNSLIAKQVGCDTSCVTRWAQQHYTWDELEARRVRLRRQGYGDIKSLQNGYKLQRRPKWFKGCAAKHDLVFVHMVVYCEANGLDRVPKGMVIHHKDHNKLNNNLENLELVTRGQHTTTHHKGVPNPGKNQRY